MADNAARRANLVQMIFPKIENQRNTKQDFSHFFLQYSLTKGGEVFPGSGFQPCQRVSRAASV
jgi:hypothetical protein